MAITDIEATVANSLVGDFATSMGPITAKCDSLAGQTNRIKDTISGMTPSSTSTLDDLLEQSMDAAYKSSAWAMAADASSQIEDMLGRCDFFAEAAEKAAKYADPSKFLKSLGKAATEKADQAIDAIADQFGGIGNFPELGIGKALSDMASTGRAVYDKVSESLESVGEATSSVIEYGKAAINTMQTELAGAAKELGNMDKLINCLTAIGGSDYAPAVDDMIDKMDCYYDKLGVFSDPALANFGEFDVESYLGGIGAIDQQTADNIKKGMNLYSKTRANSEGAIAKASDLGVKTPSALDPSAQADSIKKKTEYAESASKTSYEVPGIPGKTETKTVTIPTPDPVTPPPILEGVPPIPENKVAYTTFVKETEVIFGPDPEQERYELYDPGHASFNQYISDAYSTISKIQVTEPTTPPRIQIKVAIVSHTWLTRKDDPLFGSEKWLLGIYSAVNVFLINLDSGNFVTKASLMKVWNDYWTPVDQTPFTKEQAKGIFFKSWSAAIKDITFNSTDVQHTLS